MEGVHADELEDSLTASLTKLLSPFAFTLASSDGSISPDCALLRLLFHLGPDITSKLAHLCSICIVRGVRVILQWQEWSQNTVYIGILSQKEDNDAQPAIMHCSVGDGLHVCEYVHV